MNFNECNSVPIKVDRVFDSCSDKDCITGVPVKVTKQIPNDITIVKNRCITVSDVCMNVEPIPFNKGFYSVDLTFSFDVHLLGYRTPCGSPVSIDGTAVVSKSCILFGSETNSKTFYSTGQTIGSTVDCCNTVNLPTAIVQAVSPIVLEAKIDNVCKCNYSNDENNTQPSKPNVGIFLTLGLFYVVELTRPVTIMVPTYEYTIPKKECCSNTESPCEMFNKIKFPTEEFSPSNLENQSVDNSCPCTSCQYTPIAPLDDIVEYDSSCECEDENN